MELMQTDLPEPSAAGDEAVRHFREVGDDGMTINVLAERNGNARLVAASLNRLEQIAHDDFGLDRVWHFDANGTFSRHGREDVDALGLERGGNIVGERGDFFQLHAGRRMQFITRDGRAFGDVTGRNLSNVGRCAPVCAMSRAAAIDLSFDSDVKR